MENQIKGGRARWVALSKQERSEAMKRVRRGQNKQKGK